MAFAYNIRGQAYLGPTYRKIYGDWTGSAGDTAGTIVVAGNVPRGAVIFQKLDPLDNTFAGMTRCECSFANGFTTITVENQDNVTQGAFEITCMGM